MKDIWTSDDGKTQKHFPGHPIPKPIPVGPTPFILSDVKWARIAIRRVGSGRGSVGFGNARAVRILFDDTRRRQAARIQKSRGRGFNPPIMEFNRDDLLGPKADQTALESCAALANLMAMEGLQEVKDEINTLLQLVIQNAEREDAEKPMLEVTLNRVFLGNPGLY